MAVTVDDDFVRFGSKSYAINKINSVEVRERQPHTRGMAFLLGALTLIMLSAIPAAGVPAFVLSVVCAGAAWQQWQKAKIREYQLFLMTSSSEAEAFISRDGAQVAGLRSQIEGAIARHARG